MLGLEQAEQEAARLSRGATVAVHAAALRDAAGAPCQVFTPGEPLRLDLDLRTSAGAPDVELVVDVRTAAGLSVFRSSTPVATERGGGKLTLEIPRLSLLGGDYDVAIGVHEPGDTAPGIDRLLSFSVTDAEGGEGIADLRGSWTFVGDSVRVAQ
jgi:hypothetical protein